MNYFNTFIAVASDTTAKASVVPPERKGKRTVASLEYEPIANRPYGFTQEERFRMWLREE